VGRGDYRDAELPGRLEAGDTEGELGRDVHHIGTEPGQVVHHVAQAEYPLTSV
jgi:hypothetical protein